MSSTKPELEARVRRLADAFDRTFAEPHRPRESDGRPALAIRIDGDGYVIVASSLASVGKSGAIVALPGGPPEQLGIAGIRGELVTVFSLPLLLGYAGRTATHGWLAVIAGPRPIAVAFPELESQCVLRDAEVSAPKAARRHVEGVVLLPNEATPRGLLDLRSVVARVAPGLDERKGT